MKRLVLALFTLGALLMGSPSSIQAQKRNPYVVDFGPGIAGITQCVPGGVRTLIDVTVFDNAFELEATLAHEAIHREQLKDRSLCESTPVQALVMEAEAYCKADATIAVREFGADPQMTYMSLLVELQGIFVKEVPTAVVTRVWHDRCGWLLYAIPTVRLTPLDGLTVRP